MTAKRLSVFYCIYLVVCFAVCASWNGTSLLCVVASSYILLADNWQLTTEFIKHTLAARKLNSWIYAVTEIWKHAKMFVYGYNRLYACFVHFYVHGCCDFSCQCQYSWMLAMTIYSDILTTCCVLSVVYIQRNAIGSRTHDGRNGRFYPSVLAVVSTAFVAFVAYFLAFVAYAALDENH